MKLILSFLLALSIVSTVYGQRQRATATQTHNVGSSIRRVNFRDFTFERFYSDGENLVLHNGSDGNKIPDDLFSSNLVSVRYVDFDGDNEEEAIVTIGVEYSGSTGYVEHYLVFKNNNGAVNQVFPESRETPKPSRIVGRSLIITGPFWSKTDAHCCASFIETSIYQWRGTALVRTSRKLSRMR